MATLRYGFDPLRPNAGDDPWVKLKTIQEYLEDCEAIPPDLAYWLGEAIKQCAEDPDELLRKLGLARKRGKPAKDANAWLTYGERICELEDAGMKPEAALEKVAAELNDGNDEQYSRQQLQKFRNSYRDARSNAQRPL